LYPPHALGREDRRTARGTARPQGQPHLGRAGRTGARTALRRGLRLVCCRSTRPGCEWGRARGLWFDSAFAPRAVLLHETGAGAGGRTVGAPAPGAKGAGSVVGVWLRFRTVGGAPTGNRAGAGVWMVGAPAPGAKGAGSVVGV